MFEDNPIKQLLFETLVKLERLPPNPSESTIKTINDISDSDALKLLKELPGTAPTIVKNMGGIVSLDQLTRPLGVM